MCLTAAGSPLAIAESLDGWGIVLSIMNA